MFSMKKYEEFLETKKIKTGDFGFTPELISPGLFDWQKLVVEWALKKGRACLFENTGLGKTHQFIEWGKQVVSHERPGSKIMIVSPLAVSQQTAQIGEKFFDEPITICENETDIKQGLNISNYEKMHKFDFTQFSGVIFDESSIFKAAGSFYKLAKEKTAGTKYVLCCTATPSPNDLHEIGNHSEIIRNLTMQEMRSVFFINDVKQGAGSNKWRLKGHAKDDFWKWMSSWAAIIDHPRDLYFDCDGYDLPMINVELKEIVHGKPLSGQMFKSQAETMQEKRNARRESLTERCDKIIRLVLNEPEKQWLIWVNLNKEGEYLSKHLPDSTEVKGPDRPEDKIDRLLGFSSGKYRILITKPKIAGFGMNWQNCSRACFFPTDSWEQYKQSRDRIYRFGQKEEIDFYVIYSEFERSTIDNLKRKEKQSMEMSMEILGHTRRHIVENIVHPNVKENKPKMENIILPGWVKEMME